jgi:hypothetical protein
MRTVLLLPLAIAAAAAGCGATSEGTEQAALRGPRRDLTLERAAASEVDVASPVELAGTPIQRPAVHHPRRAPRPAPVPEAVETGGTPAAPAPAPALTHAEPAALAASTAPAPADPHELAPGKTITVIPASSGPSTTPDWTDERPSGAGRGIAVGTGGHGGGCKPRGGGGGFRGLR